MCRLRCRKSARTRRLAGALRERSDAPPPTRKRQPTALPAESGFAVLPLAPLPRSALELPRRKKPARLVRFPGSRRAVADRSEEHTSELQSLRHLVCRLLLEK